MGNLRNELLQLFVEASRSKLALLPKQNLRRFDAIAMRIVLRTFSQ